MGHKIVEAIIEDGRIKYVDTKLPSGRIRVHLIYDAAEEIPEETDRMRVVGQTSGIYRDIDGAAEAGELRKSWKRDICDWISDRYQYTDLPHEGLTTRHRFHG